MSEPHVLQLLEEALRENKSLSNLKIDGRGCKWTNVATYILKGATKSMSLQELKLITPEDFPPPKEVVDEVRRANPKLQLILDTGRESVSQTS